MILAVKRNLSNCVKKPEKNSGLQRGLNPGPRDTGAMLYQLSYEATDVGAGQPAPNVSGFIAQLVEHRTGIARSRVQTPLKS